MEVEPMASYIRKVQKIENTGDLILAGLIGLGVVVGDIILHHLPF